MPRDRLARFSLRTSPSTTSDLVEFCREAPALGALLFSRQNNVRYVHARSVTPQEREFIHRDAECRNQRIKGDVIIASEFIRHAFGSESGVQFALSRDAFFTCCHLLPFLFRIAATVLLLTCMRVRLREWNRRSRVR